MTNKKGKYRIVVHDPETNKSTYGRLIFDGPKDEHALYVITSLRKVFPSREIWMEDEQGMRVEIDKEAG